MISLYVIPKSSLELCLDIIVSASIGNLTTVSPWQEASRLRFEHGLYNGFVSHGFYLENVFQMAEYLNTAYAHLYPFTSHGLSNKFFSTQKLASLNHKPRIF